MEKNSKFGSGFISKLVTLRWWMIILWIALSAISITIFPDLTAVVKQTEQLFIPKDYASQRAKIVLANISPDQNSKSNVILVLSRKNVALTDADRSWLKSKHDELSSHKTEWALQQVISAFDAPELKSKFQSKDGSVELISIGFKYADYDSHTQDGLKNVTELFANPPSGTEAQLTGSAAISSDINKTSEEGLKKSEILTIVLVLAILLIVFRSPIAPFIPLITIAVSFMITRGLVAWAAQKGLPVSTFTESFLIAVLFGAGTDYCILIMQRFREELLKTDSTKVALIQTMKAVYQTVIFSGSTVLIAFLIVGFAQFGMYRSAVGVAIGMAITIIACVTLAPALLAVFGKSVFWPVRIDQIKGHGDSGIWNKLGSLSRKRAGLITIISLLIIAPIVGIFQNVRSFDDLAEIDSNLGSVKGFETVKQTLGEGNVFPLTIAITSDSNMRLREVLSGIEQLSEAAAAIEHVQEVRSATRPLGELVKELQVPNLIKKSNEGLSDLREGVSKISNGLGNAKTTLDHNTSKINELSKGLISLADGSKQLSTGMNQFNAAFDQTESGLHRSAEANAQISSGISKLKQTIDSMDTDLQAIAKSNPELLSDIHFLTIMGKQKGISNGLQKTSVGTDKLTSGLNQLDTAMNQMSPGLKQAIQGLSNLEKGQRDASSGVDQLNEGIVQLSRGLGDTVTGLNKIDDGMGQVQQFQNKLSAEGSKQIPGFYIPQEAYDSNDFQKALDVYVSKDGHSAKIEVILSQNPYSLEAMATAEKVRNALESTANQSGFSNVELLPTGTTAQFNELRDISLSDFIRTGSLVLIGIYIVLLLMMRSLIAPFYIMISLALNYGITMSILELVFVKLLGQDGLKWSVAFFVFLIIVALGVDYSIFLMARFKEEYKPGMTGIAMQKAMKSTGSVIISAALIMGGTFSALMLAGMHTLAEIGAGILIGLLIYAIFFMGFFVPALANLIGEGNFWPFHRKIDK